MKNLTEGHGLSLSRQARLDLHSWVQNQLDRINRMGEPLPHIEYVPVGFSFVEYVQGEGQASE